MHILETMTVEEHNRRVTRAQVAPTDCRRCPVADLLVATWRCTLLGRDLTDDTQGRIAPAGDCPWEEVP